jgi:DNA-binding response OmpR family regulator
MTLGGHRRFRAADVEAFVLKHQRPSRSVKNSPSRVLVIDDDTKFATFLKGVITTHAPGLLVDTAADAFSAGVKYEAFRPDIVTIDLHMPNLDGFEVCQSLRATVVRVRPRIVAFTGIRTQDNIERIVAAGADACVRKRRSVKLLLRELGISPLEDKPERTR